MADEPPNANSWRLALPIDDRAGRRKAPGDASASSAGTRSSNTALAAVVRTPAGVDVVLERAIGILVQRAAQLAGALFGVEHASPARAPRRV